MYNKRQFKKLNDKKVLHKIGKHWVTISIALLGALGGGAAATYVNANADANNTDNGNQANHQLNADTDIHISHADPNHQLLNHSDQYLLNYKNSSNQSRQINPENINDQVKNLKDRIIDHYLTDYTHNYSAPLITSKESTGDNGDQEINALASMAQYAGHASSEASATNNPNQRSVRYYDSVLQSLNKTFSYSESAYMNDKNMMESYRSQAASESQLASSINQVAKSDAAKGNFNAANSLMSNIHQKMSSATGFVNNASSIGESVASASNALNSYANVSSKEFSDITSLVPNINSSSSSNPSNHHKSTSTSSSNSNHHKSASASSSQPSHNNTAPSSVPSHTSNPSQSSNVSYSDDPFMIEIKKSMASVIAATNHLSTTGNVTDNSLIRSYIAANQNLNNNVNSYGMMYLSAKSAVTSLGTAAISDSALANSAASTVSQNHSSMANNISAESIDGSLTNQANDELFSATVAKSQENSANKVDTSLMSVISNDVTNATTNYQKASSLTSSSQSRGYINVTYVDQNGRRFTRSISGLVGQTGSDVSKLAVLPSGYHLNSGQNFGYKFSDQSQDRLLHITGDRQSGFITLIIKRDNGFSSSLRVPLSGLVGNSCTINPEKYVPSGYTLTKQDVPTQISITDSGFSPSTVTFNYVPKEQHNSGGNKARHSGKNRAQPSNGRNSNSGNSNNGIPNNPNDNSPYIAPQTEMGTINIIYVDNQNNVISEDPVHKLVGTTFNLSSYLNNVPGYQFERIITGNNINQFNNNLQTAIIELSKMSNTESSSINSNGFNSSSQFSNSISPNVNNGGNSNNVSPSSSTSESGYNNDGTNSSSSSVPDQKKSSYSRSNNSNGTNSDDGDMSNRFGRNSNNDDINHSLSKGITNKRSSNSNNQELPQTGNVNHQNLIRTLMILGSETSLLAYVLKKRRRNNI